MVQIDFGYKRKNFLGLLPKKNVTKKLLLGQTFQEGLIFIPLKLHHKQALKRVMTLMNNFLKEKNTTLDWCVEKFRTQQSSI